MKILILAMFLSFNTIISGQVTNGLDRDGKWKADILLLMDTLPKVHPNPFHAISKKDFRVSVSNLIQNLPVLSDDEIIVELAKIIALLNEGHSLLNPFVLSAFPLKIYWFKDGMYIADAIEKYQSAKGMRLIAINETPLKKLLQKITPLVSADNNMGVKERLPLYMITSEFLHGLHIIGAGYKATFILEDDKGKRHNLVVDTIAFTQYQKWENSLSPNSNLLYLSNKKNQWVTYLPESQIVYFGYNAVYPDFNPNPDSIVLNQLSYILETKKINKLIIDLRNNSGGNLYSSLPFLNFISNNTDINQKGKLFVIIGRKTFSAASFVTTSLELRTNAIFIGEPTSARPNHYGNYKEVILPQTKLSILISSKYWLNTFTSDKRVWTQPDIVIEPSFANYKGNKDAALDYIINYKSPANNITYLTDEVKKIMGRYSYSIDQVADIVMIDRIPKLLVTGYINTDITDLKNNNLLTGIKYLTIDLAKSIESNSLALKGFDSIFYLTKRPSNYKLPTELLEEGKSAEAITRLKEIKRVAPERYLVSESNLNTLGYNYLNRNKKDIAFALFKLNAEFYPLSSNVYDSLGEIFLTMGDIDKAKENYQKSLELDPKNFNAKKILETLK
jgi:tetratricopeptide (TPR) repeat protein